MQGLINIVLGGCLTIVWSIVLFNFGWLLCKHDKVLSYIAQYFNIPAKDDAITYEPKVIRRTIILIGRLIQFISIFTIFAQLISGLFFLQRF